MKLVYNANEPNQGSIVMDTDTRNVDKVGDDARKSRIRILRIENDLQEQRRRVFEKDVKTQKRLGSLEDPARGR